MKVCTVNELYQMCNNLCKGGKGNKKIMISSDDEGNEYHCLFFGFTEKARDIFSGAGAPFMPCGVNENNIDDFVVLG